MDINLKSKGTLYALGLIVASTMSVPAFAESTEFRRGYEQGYRDGVEARGLQDPQRGSTGRIDIDMARYGTRNASCNAQDKLQKAVNKARNSDGWRRGFSIVANNELCGDPARGSVKQLDISYRCNNGPVQRIQTREGGSVTLHCDSSQARHRQDPQQDQHQIVILEARYGSNSGGILGMVTDRSCNPRDKLQNAVDGAPNDRDGRSRIVVAANNELCGNPAPNYEKRLDVSYRCDNGPVLSAQAREGASVTLNCG